MSNLYTEPGSTGKHIFRINNTRSDLTSKMGKCQIGIETDNLILAYKDHNGDYHQCAAFVNGMIQISPHYGLFEDGDGRLGIKQLQGDGVTWLDTGQRLT